MKKNSILENDTTLRLIFAFNYFAERNDSWVAESSVAKNNKLVTSKITTEIIADQYFTFGRRFYAVNFEKQNEELIQCEIQEYDKFYELAPEYLSMRFAFNPVSRTIERLDMAVSVPNGFPVGNREYQKLINAA